MGDGAARQGEHNLGLERRQGVPSAACRFIVKVGKDQYGAVVKVRKRCAEKGEYRLLEADCVAFTLDAAKALQLDVPDDALAHLPQVFLRKPIEKNK